MRLLRNLKVQPVQGTTGGGAFFSFTYPAWPVRERPRPGHRWTINTIALDGASLDNGGVGVVIGDVTATLRLNGYPIAIIPLVQVGLDGVSVTSLAYKGVLNLQSPIDVHNSDRLTLELTVVDANGAPGGVAFHPDNTVLTAYGEEEGS